jgi:hypothetical protein
LEVLIREGLGDRREGLFMGAPPEIRCDDQDGVVGERQVRVR